MEPKYKNQTVKMLEIAKLNCFFYGWLPICIKSALYLNLVLAYFRFNIGNYFGNVKVCLNKPKSMDWVIYKYLLVIHMQKITFILCSFFRCILFSIPFGMPDYTHLKWFYKVVTSMDPESYVNRNFITQTLLQMNLTCYLG